MRNLVLLFIAGIAGLIGYIIVQGECPGAVAIRTEEQCRAASGMNPSLCQTIFSRASAVARNSASVYPDEITCSTQFGACLPHATVAMAFVPVPAGFCVKIANNSVTSMEPFYTPAAARR